MRILDRNDLSPGLAELGFMADDRTRFEQLITLANGLILVTGPTRLRENHDPLRLPPAAQPEPDRKIITVEDPVEYQLQRRQPGACAARDGTDFSARLCGRCCARRPTPSWWAKFATVKPPKLRCHASLTGHMVLSTLHTNDATSAITRLNDIGVKPFLHLRLLQGGAGSAAGAENLCQCSAAGPTRRLRPCGRCCGLEPAGVPRRVPTSGARGTGCAACGATGYHGRVGIFETVGARRGNLTIDSRTAGFAPAYGRSTPGRGACVLSVRMVLAR